MSANVCLSADVLKSLRANDLAAVDTWLQQHSDALSRLGSSTNRSLLAVVQATRSLEMAGLLVNHGLDLVAVSKAWSDGFGLECVRPEVATFLVARGAQLSPHAAAMLGLEEALRQMLDADPALVHAQGGDGARPLHFSRTPKIARLLLSRGAEVDARDEDHHSTAAQWRIGDAPDVTRELLAHGAALDVFMSAGLGDLELAQRAVAENPECTSWRIGNNSSPFPGVGFQGRGGTIYQWTLGFNRSAVEVALDRGYVAVADFLGQRTPPRADLLIACARADRSRATQILDAHPNLVASLSAEELSLLAKYCWETNFNPHAVALMLDLGFPVAAPEENHGFQPLHNAAWQGHPGVVEMLIRKGHPLNDRDPKFRGTPADWALHSCLVEKRHPDGNFAEVLALLFAAGGKPANAKFPSGDPAIDAVWQRFQAVQ